ncbi:hypothetical protein NSND_50787 [Nitrospira sp. ND1]|nr:hypothetical protein NSND_50787 [Nitrospira sp. ND1]
MEPRQDPAAQADVVHDRCQTKQLVRIAERKEFEPMKSAILRMIMCGWSTIPTMVS